VSLRGASRRSNLLLYSEIAALPAITRKDNLTILYAFVLKPEVDWRKPAGLRDVIAHAYFGIDDAILWDVVQNKVPELQRAIDLFNKREKK